MEGCPLHCSDMKELLEKAHGLLLFSILSGKPTMPKAINFPRRFKTQENYFELVCCKTSFVKDSKFGNLCSSNCTNVSADVKITAVAEAKQYCGPQRAERRVMVFAGNSSGGVCWRKRACSWLGQKSTRETTPD